MAYVEGVSEGVVVREVMFVCKVVIVGLVLRGVVFVGLGEESVKVVLEKCDLCLELLVVWVMGVLY